MSNSVGISEREKLLHRKSGRSSASVGEKSNFAQTCNLLSQYLKEKGSFSDLSRGMSGILEAKGRSETPRPAVTTMNLLPVMDRSVAGNLKPLDFFPQFAGVRSSDPVEDGFNKSDLGKPAGMESETAQMTIFYGGKVMVFNDFPADRAMEIMSLANKGSSQNKNQTYVLPNSSGPTNPTGSSTSPKTIPSSESDVAVVPTQAISPTEMPIARRKSLHRFLEKRKDRCTARAPYPAMNEPFAVSHNTRESSSMEARPFEQLELKL